MQCAHRASVVSEQHYIFSTRTVTHNLYLYCLYVRCIALVRRAWPHRWRSLAFKGSVGGVAPAQWGISRRVGVGAARANAQRLIRCLTQVAAHGGAREAGAEAHHGWRHTQAREFDDEDFFRAGYGG